MSLIIRVTEKNKKKIEKLLKEKIDISIGDYLVITYQDKKFTIKKVKKGISVIDLVKLAEGNIKNNNNTFKQ